MGHELAVHQTSIPGLLLIDLEVLEDARGWFKENWNREKLVALGLPDFGPVQNNISLNTRRGVARGIHTEPWDKLISVATGRIFGAWVDMRAGDTFGTVFTAEIGPGQAVYVPRGVGNSYQTLVDDTAYTYLVNDHWRAGPYPALDIGDPALGIEWPIPLAECEMSEKDRSANPRLSEVTPIPRRRSLVLGSAGQVGRALLEHLPEADGLDREQVDLADPAAVEAIDWRRYEVVYNAAAFTAVDAAETTPGTAAAWHLNAALPAQLARLATQHRFTLVHFSTDYVYDGEPASADGFSETDALAPLSVYGASKAAGDLALAAAPHYILRTSWVVGEGNNFVRTMVRLAAGSNEVRVVNDQVGRLTFADDLARGAVHLVAEGAAHGTYHLTSSGSPLSWAAIAREVFAFCGADVDRVVEVSTAEYEQGRTAVTARRPQHSTLSLAKIRAIGFEPVEQSAGLRRYLRQQR